ELLPNASQIPEALAYVSRRRGEWDRSEAYFQQAEQLEPRNPSLLEQHALLHTARRNFADADRYFAQALALEPDHNVLTMDRARGGGLSAGPGRTGACSEGAARQRLDHG